MPLEGAMLVGLRSVLRTWIAQRVEAVKSPAMHGKRRPPGSEEL